MTRPSATQARPAIVAALLLIGGAKGSRLEIAQTCGDAASGWLCQFCVSALERSRPTCPDDGLATVRRGTLSAPHLRHHGSGSARRHSITARSGSSRCSSDESERVQVAERGQVRVTEGCVKHVGIFRMGCVRTPIIRGTSTEDHSPLALPCAESTRNWTSDGAALGTGVPRMAPTPPSRCGLRGDSN